MKYVGAWLGTLCVIMFIVQTLFGTELFILDKTFAMQEPWRYLTAIFAHSSLAHLLSNLFGVVIFSLILEGRIEARKVLGLFLFSGILINLLTPYERSLGASGAVYAIIGVLVVLRPLMLLWLNGLPVPMIVAGIAWAIQDVMGVFHPTEVGNIAHLTGLGIGLLYGIYLWKEFGDKRHRHKRDPEIEKEIDKWEEEYMK